MAGGARTREVRRNIFCVGVGMEVGVGLKVGWGWEGERWA